MDLIEFAFAAAFLAALLVGLALAIFWPLERRRRDDVMLHVHGDRPELPR